MITQHVEKLSNYLDDLKSKHNFDSLSEYWTAYFPFHFLAATYYITLIQAAKLYFQFSQMIRFSKEIPKETIFISIIRIQS